jgi:transcription elongation factor GreA
MAEENRGKPVISSEGMKKLEDDLNHYKTVRRREIAEQIKQAISFGDLSENAEYDEAKNEQARIEEHISYLENTIRMAVIIDTADLSTDIVGVGSIVVVRDLKSGNEFEYKIVGETEADPLDGKISNESPVGKALIGQHRGETVTMPVPDGLRTLQIADIKKA